MKKDVSDMDDFEKMLEKADFSRETTQKNQLYYELFRKPIPTADAQRITLLSDADLGFVSGGLKALAADGQNTEKELLSRAQEQRDVRDLRQPVPDEDVLTPEEQKRILKVPGGKCL